MRVWNEIKKYLTDPDWLVWAVPVTLILTNVLLCITEHWTPLAKVTGVVLPLGLFYLLTAMTRRIGVVVWAMFPLMIFSGFQIVLLQLYGEAIISVDMFVNVATTNVAEASELLSNLLLAVGVVLILYLPMLFSATLCILRRHHSQKRVRQAARKVGVCLTGVGLVLLGFCYGTVGGYKVERELFPVNVAANLYIAVNRTVKSSHYDVTSQHFSYHARSLRPDTVSEVHIIVIGETSRATNWQLGGYERPTNPRLSQRLGDGLVYFDKVLSESNITHKSVPMLLSHVSAADFYDSIYTTKSVFEALNSAGYQTAFISNQRPNRSFIDYFGEQAGTTRFLLHDGESVQDMALVTALRQYLDTARNPKVAMILHSYGSHFNYRERYPEGYSRFKPDNVSEASPLNRRRLLNAYDNTIVYTDAVLDSLIATLEARNVAATLTYVSDHGEDIYDDNRERFLHASPTPTAQQLYVPMLIWMSPQYRQQHPGAYATAQRNAHTDVSSSASLFHTFIQLAGIGTPYQRAELSLISPAYHPGPRYYLNDYLDAEPLSHSALHAPDFALFRQHHISLR